jgi:predicted ATPase/DNA-binding CsgD family transcriptional regulator
MPDPNSARPHDPPRRPNLPVALTSFVGRERELRELATAAQAARLITLVGAGGCGKTRLALRAAADLGRQYPDGVYWVELAQLADPALVPQAVASAVGVGVEPGQVISDALVAYLHEQQVLLVLDNCEHLAGACAELAATLLRTPGITLLTTSREPLGVAGEMLYPLSPLSVPPPDLPGKGPEAKDLGAFEAVRLFAERARARLPGFALTAENAPLVASICRQLDGLPLAIELAGARANVMSLEQIAARLNNRLAWLAAPERAPEVHHRTLRAALDWSYELLTPAEQSLLRRLAVFAGGWSLAGAEAIGLQPDVLDLMSALVNKSLVVAETLQRGEARYRLLETVRQYAQEKLAAAGERAETADRHLAYYLQQTEETAPKLRGPYQQLWLNWLEGEHDNLRPALAWALETGNIEAGLRLANAVMGFWEMRGHAQEGATWYERLLAGPRAGLPLPELVGGLTHATFMAMHLGRAQAAMAYGREAVALAEAAGPGGGPLLGLAYAALGSAAVTAGDHQSQYAISAEAIPYFRQVGDAGGLGMTLLAHGASALAMGRYAEAHAALDESLGIFRTLADTFRTAIALNAQGDLARCEHDDARALAAYEASAALLRSVDGKRDLGSVLHNLAHVCLHQGDIPRALALLREAMALQQAQQNVAGISECLTGFAAAAAAGGLAGPGARLLAAAAQLSGRTSLSPWPAERLEYEAALARVRAGLSTLEFEQEQAVGRALPLAAAIDYALRLPLAAESVVAEPRPAPAGLTLREREVAALIGEGKSNAEIAAQFVVSKRTVEKHIANILSKLALTTRAQIVRWAIAHGLAKPST